MKKLYTLGPRFLWLWGGQLISQFGGAAHSIAAIYLVKEFTGKPMGVGVMLFATTTTTLILAPVSGVMADRFNKGILSTGLAAY